MKLPAIFLVLISVTLLFSGCSKNEKVETAEKAETPAPVRVIKLDKIQNRNGLIYEVNQTTPFTGLCQDFYPNGKKKFELIFKDGERHGVHSEWHEDGQKAEERKYKDGKQQGVENSWYKNGQKRFELNYNDGEKHGTHTLWSKNGVKLNEILYENGVKVE